MHFYLKLEYDALKHNKNDNSQIWCNNRNGILDIIILDCCEYHYIRVQENMVQHPSNNIPIVLEVEFFS